MEFLVAKSDQGCDEESYQRSEGRDRQDVPDQVNADDGKEEADSDYQEFCVLPPVRR
jgi:hypothetical protein